MLWAQRLFFLLAWTFVGGYLLRLRRIRFHGGSRRFPVCFCCLLHQSSKSAFSTRRFAPTRKTSEVLVRDLSGYPTNQELITFCSKKQHGARPRKNQWVCRCGCPLRALYRISTPSADAAVKVPSSRMFLMST